MLKECDWIVVSIIQRINRLREIKRACEFKEILYIIDKYLEGRENE